MPTYFSLDIECDKNKIYSSLMGDFCKRLAQNGLEFKSGFWGFEEDSLSDIIEWNQKKLASNFQLGFTDQYSHGYKQAQFTFSDFSEVRMFLTNRADADYFGIHIIIPEDDLSEWDKGVVTFDDVKIRTLIELAKELWKEPYVNAIQTALEGNGGVCTNQIKAGEKPSVEPFAILPKGMCGEKWIKGFSVEEMKREGVFFYQK